MSSDEPLSVSPIPQAGEKVLFITGRLAAEVTRRVVAEVSQKLQFTADVHVVGISVAALTHADWLNRKLHDEPRGYAKVFVPGWCQGDLQPLAQRFGVPFLRGPKDILDLPSFLGSQGQSPPDLSRYDIEILAEINHAPRLTLPELLAQSQHYRASGADLIDVGCIPGESRGEIGEFVRVLCAEGFRVSIDSFDRREVEQAVAAGAELVLSANASNRDWLTELGVEAVIIPDDPVDLRSMWETAQHYRERGVRHRVDPILEPIGFGFAASLARYFETRRNEPDIPIMMGVGNLTEMTQVDSAGINVLLAAICQELNIQSVLTTEVIPWCRSAVREFDLARRLMKHAIDNRTLPKHVSSELVLLRDSRLLELGAEPLQRIAAEIRDANYRIFVERGELHVMNRNGYWRGTDPFELFDHFSAADTQLEVSHAFYLGYELAKATTALTLGKQYRQDQALQWGCLTVPEVSVHERRKQARVQHSLSSSEAPADNSPAS